MNRTSSIWGWIVGLALPLLRFSSLIGFPVLLSTAALATNVPFAPPSTISSTANGASSVFAADVDGDGDVDAVSASSNDDKIAWYENNGAVPPVWSEHTIGTAADGAECVFAADMDGDGDVDVLSASSGDNTIAWYENNGASLPVWTKRTISMAAVGARSVVAADVDGDGDADVLSASFGDNTIAWYENNGAVPPVWTARTISTAANGASSVFAVDVDGDGAMDAVSASSTDNKIAWYENDGAVPPVWTPHTISTAAQQPTSVFAADVDGDGDVDALSASFDDKIIWYENDGAAPPVWTARTIFLTAKHATSVFAADVDGDGDMDALSASADNDLIAWYENDGTPGGLGDWVLHLISTAADGASSVFAIDVDRDGDVDVLSASEADDRIVDYENRTIHRNAVFPARTTITTTAGDARAVFAADVDGDGDLDALSASFLDDRIAWYENNGAVPWKVRTISAAADGAVSVYAADVDGDGDMDALSASKSDDKIAWYENDGGFVPDWTARTISTAADGASSVFAADVDGDGDLDALSASQFDDKIAWYENDGASPPSWTARTISTAADSAESVFAADVDGDGDVDVLSASSIDSEITWYENSGAVPPTWTARTISTAALAPISVFAADVDGDGDVDALSASVDGKIAWYENNGAMPPSWTARTISTATVFANSVFAADVDGDGDVDALSASIGDDKIAWYENNGAAPPSWTARTIGTAPGARAVFAADVDGDGDMDALSASPGDGKIAWYPNRGGQFGLATSDSAAATVVDGQVASILTVALTHNGRAGDTDAEWASLDLLFEETAGDPLTSAEANALFDAVDVYRDDGSGQLEPGTDALVTSVSGVALTAGELTVALSDGDPNARVAQAAPVTFFVAVRLAPAASDQTPHRFRLTHRAESGGRVEDAASDSALSRQPTLDFSSQLRSIRRAPAPAPFAPPGPISTVADGAEAVFAADVDGDGDVDALSASNGDNKIAWYENNGASPPVWTARLISSAAIGARAVAAADVDGDGDVDALSASFNDNKIAWYENNGASPPVWTARTISTTAMGARFVVAADVDGDGDMDAVSASSTDNKIAWYENNGASPPVWTARTISSAANLAISVFAADVDGDGDIDVLSASLGDNRIAWYENSGAVPPTWTARTISTAAAGAISVFAADVDGDGDVDVLSASANDDKIAWYENNGASPPAWTARVISLAAVGARAVFAADVDGDGDVDALSASQTSNRTDWYESNGASPPVWTPHTISTTTGGAISVFAADADGDGDMDVLSASFDDNVIAWHENRAIHRNAVFPAQSTISTAVPGAHSVFAADMDGDGDVDALSASSGGSEIAWYESNGALPPAWTPHTISTAAVMPTCVFAADVDGDGDVDALSASSTDNKIAWYENSGALPPVWTARTISTTVKNASFVVAADVDGDGDMDAVSASPTDHKITWHENDGASPPSWTERTISTAASNAQSVAAADVNGDGHMDVLSASSGDNKIAWYENNGAVPPAWTPRTISTAASGAASVFAADIDGDGDVDALSASSGNSEIAWYENNGASPPGWTFHKVNTGAIGARAVFAADMDGDGDVDALSATEGNDGITWYENDGVLLTDWPAHVISTVADGAASVFAADVDGDGDTDALSAAYQGNTIAWYENRGGQFGLTTTNSAPVRVFAGQVAPILTVTVRHNGRPGDTDAEWASLDLLFEETAGDSLTSAEANALFDAVEVYRDDGSGQFEPGADALVASDGSLTLAAGYERIAFGDGSMGVEVAQAHEGKFFVVVGMASTAGDTPVGSFRITHLQSSSTAEDWAQDIRLRQEFSLSASSAVVDVGAPAGRVSGVPLKLKKSAVPGDLDLSWGASCRISDIDYVVYEGLLGNFTSHVPKLCSTSGATTATITPASGRRYYLVVPMSPDGVEGSYGTASNGTPRPASASACYPQLFTACP